MWKIDVTSSALRLPVALLVLLSVPPVFSQGFNTINDRNHPELDWHVAETKHFRIMYPAHLAGIENEAASIAEASYKSLSENLDIQFEDKLRIYLSDEDEILNGFATRFGYTNIWVHVNDVARRWTGDTKWLRTVLAHELAHLFHSKAVQGNSGIFFDYLIGDPMPSFWTEGIAQYQTERWDANRGERWLRTATLDDRLSYSDGQSIWNGRLRYAVGNAQVRYLASQYGDSTLATILRHRKRSLFGLIKTHDFFEAFEKTTGESYRTFYDEWRRHINIYYNTIAGQMENADSLSAEPLSLPGQYLYDIQYSPDTTQLAVLSLTSISRPVTRLYARTSPEKSNRILAEGAIQAPFSWSPDGASIAFARRTRGENSSIINDLFLVDVESGDVRRLTYSRRAIAPSFSPDGTRIAFIASRRGTANIFVLDLQSGAETQLTRYEGDVQLSSLSWHAFSNRIAFSLFDENGARRISIVDPSTRKVSAVPGTSYEDQFPVWSPDKNRIAFTSLADQVPNVFVYDLETDSTHRVTRLVNGATVHDWLPPDSTYPVGSLIITTGTSKQRDEGYRIPASRRVTQPALVVPHSYTEWTKHQPPAPIPRRIPADPSLISSRSSYNSLRNLSHIFSFGAPYYNSEDDWGLLGFTSWAEPLGKHSAGVLAGLSVPDPLDNSFAFASYINNQLRPTLSFSAYSLLPSATAYGNTYAINELTGGDITISLPLDLAVRPYTSTRLDVRLRYVSTSLFNTEDYETLPPGLLAPEDGEQSKIRLRFIRKQLRPYRNNVIHPLDGTGVRLNVAGTSPLLGGDTQYARADLAAYTVLRMPGLHRLLVYARAQAVIGKPFNQDRPGFARFDDLKIVAPRFGSVSFTDADRVRGFRRFAYGNRLVFATIEYRMPLIPDLQTSILGLISLGATTASVFVDAGSVWNDRDAVAQRVGLGTELKNTLTIGGAFQLMHALGVAQPAPHFGTTNAYEIYYRIRTSLPF